jgi:hypothetical protein
MRPIRVTSAAAGALLAVTAMSSSAVNAHKAITSKHTYNADVQPIFTQRCGHCHVTGGVGPMSLLTYDDAFPWAESIRSELLDEDRTSDDYLRAAHENLSARELDIVLDWAVGGTPQGDVTATPQPVVLKNAWAEGVPDMVLRPAKPFQLDANVMEGRHEFVLPTALTTSKTIRSVDLLPGNPAIVRDTTISMRTVDGTVTPLGRWVPRQTPAALRAPRDTILKPGSQIVVTIHYKKTWKYEGQTMDDQSSVGLYFAGN